MKTLPEALRYCGLMGHPIVLARKDPVKGWRVLMECSYLKHAIEELQPGDKIFKRDKRKRWVEVK